MQNLPINAALPPLASLDPSVVQALLTVGIIFIMAVLIGFSRHYITSSTLKGVWAGFVAGIITLLLLEGAVFWGVKSFVFGEKAEILPENVRLVLTRGKQNLTQVLGVEQERQRPTAQSVVGDYSALTPLDAELVKNTICTQE